MQTGASSSKRPKRQNSKELVSKGKAEMLKARTLQRPEAC
jgi:hypothetical protein